MLRGSLPAVGHTVIQEQTWDFLADILLSVSADWHVVLALWGMSLFLWLKKKNLCSGVIFKWNILVWSTLKRDVNTSCGHCYFETGSPLVCSLGWPAAYSDILKICLFLCVWIFAFIYACVPCACLVSAGARSYPLELELGTFVNYLMGAGNGAWVLWKSSQFL